MIISYPHSLCLDKCYGIVYCLTNLRNGKRYVGICKTGRIKRRLSEHRQNNIRKQENPHLFHALNADDFKHELIDTGDTETELFDKEKMYIREFRSAEDKFGYNLTLGGDGTSRYFRPYEEAKAYTRSLGFKNTSEWFEWIVTDKRPKDIPSNPSVSYRGLGWTTWRDYIGVGRKPRNLPWLPYEEARAIVRPLGLTERGHRRWHKENKHLNTPGNPDRAYQGKGWIGWGDYLGTQKSALEQLYERNANPEFHKKCGAGLRKYWQEHSEENLARIAKATATKLAKKLARLQETSPS